MSTDTPVPETLNARRRARNAWKLVSKWGVYVGVAAYLVAFFLIEFGIYSNKEVLLSIFAFLFLCLAEQVRDARESLKSDPT